MRKKGRGKEEEREIKGEEMYRGKEKDGDTKEEEMLGEGRGKKRR